MNHHPTPETDANAFPDFERGGDIVLADVARDLEQRLAECREALSAIESTTRGYCHGSWESRLCSIAKETLTKTAPKP